MMKSFFESMVSLGSLTLFLFLTIVPASSTSFIGTYQLVDLYDENFQQIPLPEGPTYQCSIVAEDNSILQLGLQIGNSMLASIQVADNDDDKKGAKIQVGHVLSTEMMPPEDVWKVEQTLSHVLPQLNQMSLVEYKGKLLLVMSGDQGGKVVFQPLDDTETIGEASVPPDSKDETMVVDGTYNLVDLYDATFQQVPLPDGPTYRCTIGSTTNDDGATVLQFGLTIGNRISTTITMLPQHRIQMGLIATTEMMPPEPIWKVETAFLNVLPKMSQLHLVEYHGRQLLVMKGDEGGKIVLARSEEEIQ